MKRLACLVLITACGGPADLLPPDPDAPKVFKPEPFEVLRGPPSAVVEVEVVRVSVASPVTAYCSEPFQRPAGECTSAADCGGGDTSDGCAGCPPVSRGAICEAGACVEISEEVGTMEIAFLPEPGAQSFVIAAVLPIDASGGRVTCARLTSTCELSEEPGVTVVAAASDLITTSSVQSLAMDIEAGDERLILVRLHALPEGKGAVIASGCAEHVVVAQGELTGLSVPIR